MWGTCLPRPGANGTRSIVYDFICGEYKVITVNEPGRTVSYIYDANGNLQTQTCLGAIYSYLNYDARNRAHNFSAQIDGNIFNFSYDYDVYGRVTSITYPGRAQAVTYNYDELDRLQSIPGFVTSCGYDPDNKLTDMLFGNSINNHYDYRTNDDKLAAIKVWP
jgi:YD repeat-containing protein